MISSPDSLRRVFQEGFSAFDVAQPLLSFDGSTSCDHVKAVMLAKRIDVVGIRTDGAVTGFAEIGDLASGSCDTFARPIGNSLVVAATLPLGPLVLRLKGERRLFVVTLGQASGLVTRQDMQTPPARMWLFGMITLMEMRFSNMIVQHLPNEAWREFLSEGRIQKAQELLALRRARDQQVSLSVCLQFADKVCIIASSEQLRRLTRFESKRQVEKIGKQLENLRNNLAHAQDIIASDWETIVALAEQLDSILNGPETVQPLSTSGT